MTSVPFDIPIIDDMIQEGTEDFRVTISSSSLPDDVSVGSPDEATVTILDDDCKPNYLAVAPSQYSK